MEPMKMLIADDNKQITSVLAEYAKKEGYQVVLAHDGEEAMHQFEIFRPDIVLLDVMMPKRDGFEICKEIRRESNVPIIMITARGEDFEKIMGLDIGADDYIVKPFEGKELVARVKAVLRRYLKEENDVKIIEMNNLTINLSNYELLVGGKVLETPPKELELLYFLASHPNRVFTREQLLEDVWGFDYYGDSRTVDVHVKRLREKLEGFEEEWQLKTVWGVGYKFEVK